MEKFAFQSMTWPENEEENLLYVRTDGEICRSRANSCVLLKKGNYCQLDTYFNSMSTGKWKKYTKVENLLIDVSIKGSGIIRVCFLDRANIKQVLWESEWSGNGEQTELPCKISIPDNGMFYLEFEASEDHTEFRNFTFSTNIEERREIKLSAVICTYKREKDIQRTLTAVTEEIYQNADSPLREKLRIFVSDNGKTLPPSEVPQIQIEKNKNLGGAGGFTRGIMESLKNTEFPATHVVLMDDDAIIRPHILERTWCFLSLLKEEFSQHTIAGALLNQKFPYIQFESGAQWNQGKVKILKNQLDLRKQKNLLWNECEDDPIEYSGWWYSCIPVSTIKKIGLPLPLFVHRDDVEYGLRMERRFITLNGIGIWHEPYINKLPGSAEYYDVRNLAVINVIHYPQINKKQFAYMVAKWTLGNVFRCRYQYVLMNLKGIEDFCKGAGWMLEVDGERLHGELREYNYKLCPVKELYGYRGLQKSDFQFTDATTQIKISMKDMIKYVVTLNGVFLPNRRPDIAILHPYGNEREIYRRKELIYIDSDGMCLHVHRKLTSILTSYCMIFKTVIKLKNQYDAAASSYQNDFKKLISWEEWEKRLKNGSC